MKRAYLISVLVLVLAPAAARADTFCVQGPCPSNGTTKNTLADAISAADGNGPSRDRIEIGAHTITTPSVSTTQGSPVDIVGAGASQTRIVGASGAQQILALASDSAISDVTLEFGQDTVTGIDLYGKATRIRLGDGAGNNASIGVLMEGGSSLTDSQVLFPVGGTVTAIDASPGAGASVTVSRVAAAGVRGARTEGEAGSALNITQSTFDAALDGATNTNGGTLRISNSLITMSGPGIGLSALHNGGNNAARTDARNVTVIGDGAADSVGASADASDGTATVNLDSSIIQGFEHSLQRSGVVGLGTSNLTVSYSDRPNTVNDVPGLSGSIADGGGNTAATPGFAGVNDYHLASTSPLIDKGDPAALGPFDSTLDVFGSPRLNDGDGDGTARSDIGAAEYQRAATPPNNPSPTPATPQVPPAIPKDTVAPTLSAVSLSHTAFAVTPKSTAVAALARGTTLRYRLSEAAKVRIAVERRELGARVKRGRKRVCATRTRSRRKAPTCVRYVAVKTLIRGGKVGANSVAFTGRIGGRALRPGRYRMRVIATDRAGNRSTTRTVSFRIVR